MVAFLAGRLRCLAVAELEPCEHGLANMDSAIVDDIGLDDFPSVCLLDLGNRITEQVITHVTEVKGFVSIRG